MSHMAVRIVADWLQDSTNGINALSTLVPRLSGDPLPPEVAVFNETQHGWVARNRVPKPHNDIAFPAVIVFLQSAKFDAGVPDSQDTAARTVDGTVQLAVQLLMDESQTELAVAAGIYLLRAIRNSLLLLDDPANQAARERTGVRIDPSQSVMQGQLDAPESDSVLSIGALVVVYPTTEITALI